MTPSQSLWKGSRNTRLLDGPFPGRTAAERAAGTRGPHAAATLVGKSRFPFSHPLPRIPEPSLERNQLLPAAGISAGAAPQFAQPGDPHLAPDCPRAAGLGGGDGAHLFPASSRARSRARKRPGPPALGGEAAPRSPLPGWARSRPRRAAPGDRQLPPVGPALPAVPQPPRPRGTASSCKYSGGPPSAGGSVRWGSATRPLPAAGAALQRPYPETCATLPGSARAQPVRTLD